MPSNAERLDAYANWLRANAGNKGTPEFEKVAGAYRTLRSSPVEGGAGKQFMSPSPPRGAVSEAAKPSYAQGLGANLAQGLTGGFADEAAGIAGSLGGGIVPIATGAALALTGREDMMPGYAQKRDQFREVRNDFAEENPVAAFGANLLGSVPSVAALPIRAGGSIGIRAAKGVGLGTGYGAVTGIGEGEGGTAGRLASGTIGAAAGGILGGAGEAAASALGRIVQGFIGRTGRPPQLIDQSGALTTEGRNVLRAVGMNPDEATPSFLTDLQTRINRQTQATTAPVEANVRQALAEGMDIPVPLTRGQKTLDPNHQGFEYDARAGTYGDLARNEVAGVDDRAEAALRGNMDALRRRVAGGAEPIPYMGAGGEMVSANLEGAERAANAGVNAAYNEARAGGMAAGVPRDATNELVSNMRGAISGYAPESAPAVYAMLERFGGPIERAGSGDTRISRIFDLRSQLTNAGAGGTPEQGAGRAAARAVDDFLTSALERDLISGDPAAVERWTRAVASRREYGRLFEGKDLIERLTARDRISGEHQLVTPPEKAANLILGASNLGFTNRPELARAMGTLRDRLGADSREWNALREETLLRLFQMAEGGQRAEGRGLSGAKLASAVDSFATKNAPLWRLMFNPDEQTGIRRIAQVMKLTTVPVEGARNNSGTAYAIARMVKGLGNLPVAGRVLNWLSTHYDNAAKLMEAQNAARGVIPAPAPTGSSYAGAAAGALGSQMGNRLSR